MSRTWTRDLDEAGVVRLAELLALKIRVGDVIALRGDLGAGKTTLARALIAALLGDRAVEVPSPTFSLSQVYATPRLAIAHYDFYRLNTADEAAELGFEEATATGAAIVEWPERAATLLPASRYDIERRDGRDGRSGGAPRHGAGPRRCRSPCRAHRRADGVSRRPAALAGGAHRLSAGRCLHAHLCAPLRRSTTACC